MNCSYRHERGFSITGNADAIEQCEILFGRLRVLEMFVQKNKESYDKWLHENIKIEDPRGVSSI